MKRKIQTKLALIIIPLILLTIACPADDPDDTDPGTGSGDDPTDTTDPTDPTDSTDPDDPTVPTDTPDPLSQPVFFPADGSEDADSTTDLDVTITFNIEMNQSSLSIWVEAGTTCSSPAAAESANASSLDGTGTIYTLSFTASSLQAGAEYTTCIDSSAASISGESLQSIGLGSGGLEGSSWRTVPGPPQASGDLLITEIMIDSTNVVGGAYSEPGEYIEIYNPRSVSFDLNGVVVGDNDVAHTVTSSMIIGSGEYYVFARSANLANGGPEPDVVYPEDIRFGNGSEDFLIEYDGTTIDYVLYDSTLLFDTTQGAAMNLDPASFDAASNDVGTNWCDSTTPYGTSPVQFGTPGTANIDCP